MENRFSLWYDEPANTWEEALPTGNGKLGAMTYGCVFQEVIQVNEDSVWYGGGVDRINQDAKDYFPTIRRYMKEGRIDEAQRLSRYALSGTPESQRAYQSLGDIYIGFHYDDNQYSNYKRELDINDAQVNITYTIGEVTFKRSTITSFPDNVTMVTIEADHEGSINFDALLRRGKYMDNPSKKTSGNMCIYGTSKFFDTVEKVSDSQIMLKGNLGVGGSDFCMSLKACIKNGTCDVIGEHLLVRGADKVVLYFSAATTFRYENHIATCLEMIEKAVKQRETNIIHRHRKDYWSLFNTMDICLTNRSIKDFNHLPTDIRLDNFRKNKDVSFVSLYFQYCRYLLIASSREGSLPANLQGIWCKDFDPPWDSKFTININLQMNYWAAEMANLAQCHLPLFDFLERLVESGEKTADKMYGCSGFVAHHNTDIWADTAPQDIVNGVSYWVYGGAWLSLHIWQHYIYTQDIEFLEKYYYIMKKAALFFFDYLVKDDSGYYVSCPSSSPENAYALEGKVYALSIAPSMDNQILTELFTACLKGGHLLNEDKNFLSKLVHYRDNLLPIKIGTKGQILEWEEEYEEFAPGHRHFSHLFALCPGTQITIDKTPKLAEAARKSIDIRLENGSAGTGWSRAWVINFFTRLHDGNEAWYHLAQLFEISTMSNLFNDHPPFQIDGNFGALAAICQMFAQSYNGIVLLPALPDQIPSGYIRGLILKGNINTDLYWEEGQLNKAVFYCQRNKKIEFMYGSKLYTADIKAEEELVIEF